MSERERNREIEGERERALCRSRSVEREKVGERVVGGGFPKDTTIS